MDKSGRLYDFLGLVFWFFLTCVSVAIHWLQFLSCYLVTVSALTSLGFELDAIRDDPLLGLILEGLLGEASMVSLVALVFSAVLLFSMFAFFHGLIWLLDADNQASRKTWLFTVCSGILAVVMLSLDVYLWRLRLLHSCLTEVDPNTHLLNMDSWSFWVAENGTSMVSWFGEWGVFGFIAVAIATSLFFEFCIHKVKETYSSLTAQSLANQIRLGDYQAPLGPYQLEHSQNTQIRSDSASESNHPPETSADAESQDETRGDDSTDVRPTELDSEPAESEDIPGVRAEDQPDTKLIKVFGTDQMTIEQARSNPEVVEDPHTGDFWLKQTLDAIRGNSKKKR